MMNTTEEISLLKAQSDLVKKIQSISNKVFHKNLRSNCASLQKRQSGLVWKQAYCTFGAALTYPPTLQLLIQKGICLLWIEFYILQKSSYTHILANHFARGATELNFLKFQETFIFSFQLWIFLSFMTTCEDYNSNATWQANSYVSNQHLHPNQWLRSIGIDITGLWGQLFRNRLLLVGSCFWSVIPQKRKHTSVMTFEQ